MTSYRRGEWTYSLNIEPLVEKFQWYIVRLKIDPTRPTHMSFGTWVAGGITMTREEAERDGMAAIDKHSQGSA